MPNPILFWMKLGRVKRYVSMLVFFGWFIPILVLSVIMIYLYFFPRQAESGFQALSGLWLDLTGLLLVASLVTMLPFPLFIDMIKDRESVWSQPDRNEQDNGSYRNLLISLCTLTSGLLIVIISTVEAIGEINGAYQIRQPGVEGECAYCSVIAIILIYMVTYGVAMVLVTVSPLRTNWSPPREIGTIELARRTLGFIIFVVLLVSLQFRWAWVYSIGGLILLLAPKLDQIHTINIIREWALD
jgi:hypothetical protein